MDKQPKETYYTQERLKGELHFCIAERIGQTMLDSGLISEKERDIFSSINLQTFSPLFAEIYPELPCYSSSTE